MTNESISFFIQDNFYLKQLYFFNILISLSGANKSFPVEIYFLFILFILIFIGAYYFILTHPAPFSKLYFYYFYLLHLVLRQKSKYIYYMFNKIKNLFMKMKTAMSVGYTAISVRENGMSVAKTGLSFLHYGTSFSQTAMPDINYGMSATNYGTYIPNYANSVANYANSISETAMSERKTAYCVSNYAKTIFTEYSISNRKLIQITSLNSYTNMIINNIITNNIMYIMCQSLESPVHKLYPEYFPVQMIHLNKQYFLTFKTLEL